MPELEFSCFFCKEPAEGISFYSKIYQESGKDTIENPALICRNCYDDPEKKGKLFASRGGWESVVFLSFAKIVKMSERALGIFLSKSGKEKNDLANKTWRKRIFRIHYRMRNPSSSIHL